LPPQLGQGVLVRGLNSATGTTASQCGHFVSATLSKMMPVLDASLGSATGARFTERNRILGLFGSVTTIFFLQHEECRCQMKIPCFRKKPIWAGSYPEKRIKQTTTRSVAHEFS
jgi:hypothetical protein